MSYTFKDFIASDAYKKIHATLNQIYNEPTVTALKKLHDDFSKLTPLLKIAENIRIHPDNTTLSYLYDNGWILTRNVDQYLVDELSSILKLDNSSSRSDVNHAIVEYCINNNYENLERIISGWSKSPLLKSRYSILNNCLKSIQNPSTEYNRFNLIIPTLICQIDGILRDYITSDGLSPKDMNFLDNGKTVTLKDYYTEGRNHESIIDDMFSGFFAEHLYKKTDGADSGNIIINRHLIAHGIDLNYGNIENAIRLIFIIDIINESYLSRYSDENSK